MAKDGRLSRLRFDELLLGGVILLIITLVALGAAVYVAPGDHLELRELQPVIRIADEADFPVGTSRVRNWGGEIILVIRPDAERLFALEGLSPADGCILRWDPESSRVLSPCRHIVYDLRGNVIVGLSTKALKRYAVFVRDGVVYVSAG